MKKCLIVYYSRTGVTAKVAKELAQACGADLEQIIDRDQREGLAGYLRSAWQALRRRHADIAAPLHHAGDYPLIVLGTPVWAGHMSAPMRSYIAQQRAQFRNVGLFCTMGGSGGPDVLDAMAELCGTAPLARLCLRQRDVLADRHRQALHPFAEKLVVRAPAEPAPAPEANVERPA